MVEIPLLNSSEAPRARRWDALILGSGIPALVAAARIGGAGQRVLVVEEEAHSMLPPPLREPFFLAGIRDEGVLDACLRALTVPLIDRRRFAAERLAYQIAADPYRLEIGQPIVTADELVTWGLAKPDDAQSLVRHLIESSEIERQLLLQAPFVRIGRRVAGSRGAPGIGNHKRGLPGDAATATGPLGQVIAAQIRGLSNLGQTSPSPEAQARLLGVGLAGGAGFADAPPWLADLLRKRVTTLYGDFRTLTGKFELVSVSGQPGIRVIRTGEIWLGRSLVLAAPLSSLHDTLGGDPNRPTPSLLDRRVNRGYRAVFLFRIPTTILPEGMSARVILPGARTDNTHNTHNTGVDTNPGAEGDHPTVTVTAFPNQTQLGCVDLVARALIPTANPESLPERLSNLGQSITARLKALMPFCGDELQMIEVTPPQWDTDDGWLEDPPPGTGWPAEIDLRLSTRPPIYQLDRAAVAGLGLEGDLLLGWRGGDAIAAELA
jgi:hypothetical protein